MQKQLRTLLKDAPTLIACVSGMPLCRDRDAEAAQNIEWTRKGISSIALGSSLWDNGTQKTSDSGEAFRIFSKAEMEEVRGAMAEEVQNDLRAVHFHLGFRPGGWESEEMRRSKSLVTKKPQRSTKDLQRTQFKLGSEKATDYASGSKADH